MTPAQDVWCACATATAFQIPGGPQSWRLPAQRLVLSGVVLGFMPLEELLFAAGFGAYWVGVYEHFTWHHSQSVRREDRSHALAS